MFLFYLTYYIQLALQTQSSSQSSKETNCFLNNEQRSTTKERFYFYIQTFDEKKINDEGTYKQILQDIKNIAIGQFKKFFENFKIPMSKESIIEVVSNINELITKETDDLIKNLHNEKWHLFLYRREGFQFKKICLWYLKNQNLEKPLSFHVSSGDKNQNKIFYIDKIKVELKNKKKNSFQEIFDVCSCEFEMLTISPNPFYTSYDRFVLISIL